MTASATVIKREFYCSAHGGWMPVPPKWLCDHGRRLVEWNLNGGDVARKYFGPFGH